MTDIIIDQLSVNAEKSTKTQGGMLLAGSCVTINLPNAPVRYLYSGWQSWSLSAWVDVEHPIRPIKTSNLLIMHTDSVYAHETCPHGSWYGAVELADEQILFLGALGLESHVTMDRQSLIGRYETGDGEWFLATGDENEILARYTDLLEKRLGKGRMDNSYSVWCSWYSLYTEIYETQLLKILSDLGDLPFDVFQVDDGWQVGIGDWVPNTKFSSGMDNLASTIKKTGRKAGLWLAPLLIVPSSSIYREHRDWLLHDDNGSLVSAGFNWSEQLFALDTTHPAVIDWLAALMKKVRYWGYEYAKLDFLYAGALPGKRYLDMPRETAYRYTLKVIREALGDAYFLTCGAPILPSIGLCDGVRVGPDVAGYFSSPRDDILLRDFAIPGVRNALRTTVNRLWLQPLVNTDPDVVYFRSRQNKLTLEQKNLLQDMAQIAGFKATSDVPAWLTESERTTLREFLYNKPEIHKTGRTTYKINDREVDFGSHINLPPHPVMFANMLGKIISTLANVPVLMKVFDKLGNYSLKKMLKSNPV